LFLLFFYVDNLCRGKWFLEVIKGLLSVSNGVPFGISSSYYFLLNI